MDLKELRLTQGKVAARHPWELARLSVVNRLLSKAKIAEKEQMRIVDMGSGDTFVVETLLSQHPNWVAATAVDIAFTNEDIEFLTDKYHKQGVPITLFKDMEAIPEDKPADVILLLDVLEHIDDHEGFLRQLVQQKFVTPDTHLLITVPAFQSLFCAHDVFLDHFRRYTRKLLVTTADKNGWKAFTSGYFFFSLLGPRLIQKIIGSKPNEEKGIGGHKKSALDGFMRSVLIGDYRFGQLLRKIGLRLPGLSTYAICKLKQP